MKKILDFDIGEQIEGLIIQNSKSLKVFFALFIANLLIYGQKIFFYSLAPDDIGRVYNGGGELASWLGRWMGGIVNQHVFSGAMHIQPYLNGILGVFSFTLAAFLTAKILKMNRVFEIVIFTLLISATPMIANNLYFNANIAVWLSTPLGIIGLLLAQKPNRLGKILGLVFLAVAIGCYQTIVQVAISIAMIQLIIRFIESKNQEALKRAFLDFIFLITFIVAAFAFSNLINFLYIKFYHLEVTERLGVAMQGNGFSLYWQRLGHMFHSNFGLVNFANPLLALYRTMALFSLFGSIFVVIKSSHARITKLILSVFIALLFLYIPLVINLPNITGNVIPIRAHYTIGWFLAGFFAIQVLLFKRFFKTIASTVAVSIIVLSICYINIYFDAATRQTSSDIIRANQIVSRIRAHANYPNEPVKFTVVGTKGYSVTGWDYDHQALFKDWSKISVFKHFTDLNFEIMSDAEYNELENLIIQNGNEVDVYPGKNSIYIDGNRVVLFLDTKVINNNIALNRIQKMQPNVKSHFDLYLIKGKLVYFRSACTENDIVHPFYLHVYPRDSKTLPSDQDHVVMYFPFDGTLKDGQCIATQDLPNFDIKQINTGQFSNDFNEKENKPYTIYWKSSIQLD